MEVQLRKGATTKPKKVFEELGQDRSGFNKKNSFDSSSLKRLLVNGKLCIRDFKTFPKHFDLRVGGRETSPFLLKKWLRGHWGISAWIVPNG